MKKMLIITVLLVFISGCQSGNEFKKTFYQGNVTFTLTPEAQQSVGKIVRLLEQSYEEEGIGLPLPDGVVLPIYVAADTNRDHHISNKEAKVFQEQGILEFENQLGQMRFKPKK